jgi:hypothetical protein
LGGVKERVTSRHCRQVKVEMHSLCTKPACDTAVLQGLCLCLCMATGAFWGGGGRHTCTANHTLQSREHADHAHIPLDAPFCACFTYLHITGLTAAGCGSARAIYVAGAPAQGHTQPGRVRAPSCSAIERTSSLEVVVHTSPCLPLPSQLCKQ